MKKMVAQKGGSLNLLSFALIFAFSEPPINAQREFADAPASQQLTQNWAESPPGTFLEQSAPANNQSRGDQLPQQQPATNPAMLGQPEPGGNSGQQWSQSNENSAPQWSQPNPNQLGQSQWQQPDLSTGQSRSSQFGQPPPSLGPLDQSQYASPSSSEPVTGQSNQTGLSEWQVPTTDPSINSPGPFAGNEPVGRTPLLGEVLKQEQTNMPLSDSTSVDQSGSLNNAAADALNSPVGSMAAGALSSLGLGQGSGQMSPQQIQQMLPGVLNFLMNVMPSTGNANNRLPGQTNYGGFPRFGSPSVLRRSPQPQGSPGISRAINNAIRRGRLPGMNQMHF